MMSEGELTEPPPYLFGLFAMVVASMTVSTPFLILFQVTAVWVGLEFTLQTKVMESPHGTVYVAEPILTTGESIKKADNNVKIKKKKQKLAKISCC